MAKRKRNDKGTISNGLTNGHLPPKASKPGPKPTTVDTGSSATLHDGHTASGRGQRTPNRPSAASSKVRKTEQHIDVKTELPTVQIVIGSYERVLHGITATVAMEDGTVTTKFADSFLFNAHASAVRCLALSPMPEDASQGVYLASGGSDERINVYSLSTAPVPEVDSRGRKVPSLPNLGPNPISENPLNRELGTLVQHSSNITSLHFPSRSKLLSGSEDNTISVTRVRDLEVVSTVKAPKPKISGQASGDSASAGTVPTGINDFAIHPSMKLMVSVGRGERCMRLWNLVTGKKAGVLNFDRSVLQAVKEGKYSHGEGRRIQWNKSGSEFAVAFERGLVIFGQDSKPKCTLLPLKLTKVHQIAYFAVNKTREFLAVSTEDGKVLFFDTSTATAPTEDIPTLHPFAYTGGEKHDIKSRVKDFVVLDLIEHGFDGRLVVVGCSDGNVKLITIAHRELLKPTSDDGFIGTASTTPYSTGSRITCLTAFVMFPAHDIDGGLSEAESALDSQAEDSSDHDE